ncbi:OmpA/MotB family protein [Agaribacterium haliotis]|uniref:OmpA/MotB family protein n=1 Tax=Agaribacterium haliotis TaxID=2013869 RepID=UPI000BB56FA0|nr:OmpA family protein [Agaribacterium haliotis]
MFASSRADHSADSGADWISVSDLMAGLMMVFLCIAMFMMRSANIEREKVREIAESYAETQQAIYHSLNSEFQHDFVRWGAYLDEQTLTLTFQGADAMFETGQAQISGIYRDVFQQFFARYLKALAPYRESITGINIEGHTSSSWSDFAPSDSYFKNLALSQERASSVLEYLFYLDAVAAYRSWIIEHVAAVGYSSSHLIVDANGNEDVERSKRVVFRVMTNSESRIRSILED